MSVIETYKVLPSHQWTGRVENAYIFSQPTFVRVPGWATSAGDSPHVHVTLKGGKREQKGAASELGRPYVYTSVQNLKNK
jgi:hypothetical protein